MKNKNFFQVSHTFEENFGHKLTPAEKYFYVILVKLTNRYAGKNKDGWFWHTDRKFETKKGDIVGFESFGFSPSSSKRIRKKLKNLGLIQTKKIFSKTDGYRAGTFYRINDLLEHNPKSQSDP